MRLARVRVPLDRETFLQLSHWSSLQTTLNALFSIRNVLLNDKNNQMRRISISRLFKYRSDMTNDSRLANRFPMEEELGDFKPPLMARQEGHASILQQDSGVQKIDRGISLTNRFSDENLETKTKIYCRVLFLNLAAIRVYFFIRIKRQRGINLPNLQGLQNSYFSVHIHRLPYSPYLDAIIQPEDVTVVYKRNKDEQELEVQSTIALPSPLTCINRCTSQLVSATIATSRRCACVYELVCVTSQPSSPQ
ncbi:hypothetical protein J6590_057462 [Homalodisca vitripennis]|nr:hypothetical protein J6590_057462 [Homalodisca vitripennis]